MGDGGSRPGWEVERQETNDNMRVKSGWAGFSVERIGFSGGEGSSSLDLKPPFSSIKKDMFMSSVSFARPHLENKTTFQLQIVRVPYFPRDKPRNPIGRLTELPYMA